MVTDAVAQKQRLLFSHKLRRRASRVHSWLCIGLDPELDKLPAHLPRTPRGALDFCAAIVDSTRHYAAAFKPNTAFFEAMGPEGWQVLAELCADVIPADIPVIIDAKRGDMDNTSRAYARAFFEILGADALTVNPYLGPDSLQPFMGYAGRCVFVLTRTSNPGGTAVQEQHINGSPLYLDIAAWAAELDGETQVGFVVGATEEDAIRAIRSRHPEAPLLLPGIGAQGAQAGTVMKAGADADGGNALPSVSRSVLYASAQRDFAAAASRAAASLAAETWLKIDVGR